MPDGENTLAFDSAPLPGMDEDGEGDPEDDRAVPGMPPRREPDERVERTDVGASIEVAATRGTGTRDQEKWKIKGKGSTAGEALAEFEEVLEAYEAEYSDRVRAIQPEEADDE